MTTAIRSLHDKPLLIFGFGGWSASTPLYKTLVGTNKVVRKNIVKEPSILSYIFYRDQILYNGNNFSLNLSGYFLSDNENDLTRWTFPNTTIQANGYLIVWCDTAGGTQSGLHTTYRLSADQEEVYLTDPSGIVIDAVHFVNMPTDVAYARVPNGTGTFIHQGETYKANNQNISGITNISASGGSAQSNGMSPTIGENIILGFSFSGNSIPPGNSILTHIGFSEYNGSICLSDPVFSNNSGVALSVELGDCFN